MGMFDRLFGRGKGKKREEPQRPAPQPTVEPTPEAGEGGAPKKRGGGLLGRLFGGRKKKEAPAEAPPAAPGEPSAPSAPAEGAEPGEGPEAAGGGPAAPAPPARDYSNAPSSINVRIAGTWIMSRKRWVGTVKGTLTGAAVVEFLQLMDEGTEDAEQEAVMMVCEEFDQGSGFASAVNLDESHWEPPSW